MGWIAIDNDLIDHRKTRRAAKLLKVEQITVVGLLIALWSWCDKRARDGDESAEKGIIGTPEPWEIAEISRWDEDPDQLIAVLLEAHWIDRKEHGLEFHDWMDHQGAMIQKQKAKREKNTQRMRGLRAKDVQDTCDAQEEHTNSTSSAQGSECNAVQLPRPRLKTKTKDEDVDKDKKPPPPPPHAREAERVVAVEQKQPGEDKGEGMPTPPPEEVPSSEVPSSSSPNTAILELEGLWSEVRGRITHSTTDYAAMRQALSTGLTVADIRAVVAETRKNHKGEEIRTFGYFLPAIERVAQKRKLISMPLEQHPLAQMIPKSKKPRLDDLDRYWAQVETGCWDPDAYENGHELQEKHGLDPERREAS